jgi:glucose/arabinose dehydrogenase
MITVSCGEVNDRSNPRGNGMLQEDAVLSPLDCKLRPEPSLPIRVEQASESSLALRLETVAAGLETPWSIAFLPNHTETTPRFLVSERPGRIRLYQSGRLEAVPVATVAVGESGEGGLLGIALHPRFGSENRQLFIYYTAPENVNRLDRYTLSDDLRTATFERRILDGIPAGTFHNGGRLRFGPDGMLYVGTGDAREPELSQDPQSLAGKLLRMTPDGEPAPDNPFPNSSVYLLGIRNTQGFDWLSTRSLIVSDHGPSGEMGRSGHDEITVASAGANLGWPRAWRCDEQPGLVRPSVVWQQALPPGGAAIYRGGRVPSWKGSLFIGALLAEELQRWSIRIDEGGQVSFEPGESYRLSDEQGVGLGRIRDVISGPDGYIYLTTSNCDGRGSCPPSVKDRVVRIG